MGRRAGDGRYLLEEVIGTGGMATVWRARDTELDRAVALKRISDSLSHDDAFMARFRREAMLASSLQHPNLVRIFDFDPDARQPFIVMELIEGPTLAELLEGERPIDGAALAEQLLAALEHIHSAGIVHRDVKPANILLDADGLFRLTDFGIARSADATRHTATGQVIGTLRYMAPEVQAGEPATPASDLYSAGVVLGEAGIGAAATAELRDPDPGRRPESAAAALALLESPGTPRAGAGEAAETAPTVPLPGGARRPPDASVTGGSRGRRVAAVLALAAAAAVLIAAAALSGGDESGTGSTPAGPATAPSTATETTGPSSTTETTEAPTTTTTETTTVPAPPADTTEPEPPVNPAGKVPPGQAKRDEKPPKPPKPDKEKKPKGPKKK